MKTSSKIIILFAVLLLSGTLSLFIATKMHMKGRTTNLVTKSEKLQPFTVIVAQGLTEFTIEGSETNAILWKASIGNQSKNYRSNLFVRNDTLYVKNTLLNNKYPEWIVIRAKSLRSVFTTGRDKLSMSNLKGGPLCLYANFSSITINNWFEKKDERRKRVLDLTIVAKDGAEVELYNTEVGQLSVILN